MDLQIDEAATEKEICEVLRRAPSWIVRRVLRQRVIAEMLERAAARAEGEGRTREAAEMREQAAEARRVANDAIRKHQET